MTRHKTIQPWGFKVGREDLIFFLCEAFSVTCALLAVVCFEEECWKWDFSCTLLLQTCFFLVFVLVAENDPAFQQSMVEGGGAQRAVVDLLVEQVSQANAVTSCVDKLHALMFLFLFGPKTFVWIWFLKHGV